MRLDAAFAIGGYVMNRGLPFTSRLDYLPRIAKA